METPSSSTRTNFIFSRKIEESGMKLGQREERFALIDITNDSPIVGLAMGSLKTPLSKKKRVIGQSEAPGSGEALLRGQVKTLLQKVEEEAELENRPFSNLLLNLTPANTPQLGAVSCFPFLIPQMMLSEKEKGEGSVESEDLITRSLLMEFSEKSFDSSSSNDGDCDDDDASVWSIQANASSTRDEEEEEEGDYNDLCEEGIVSKIEFLGLDDEIVSVTDSCSP